jgi:tRNA A37 methylthiotransferase MiaB
MTREWKNAIKAKRRFSKKFSKNPTQENFELKRKWRNEATKQRRTAIIAYWKKVSDNINSRDFYKTFTPFLEVKNKKAGKVW